MLTSLIQNAEALAELALKNRLASVGLPSYAQAGGLIGYGPNLLESAKRAAYFADKILKGTKPGDIPIEQPTRFELAVNLKTAKALGLKIPNTILVRAEKVIE